MNFYHAFLLTRFSKLPPGEFLPVGPLRVYQGVCYRELFKSKSPLTNESIGKAFEWWASHCRIFFSAFEGFIFPNTEIRDPALISMYI